MAQISLKKTPRLGLAVRKKPYFETVSPGVSLGYRRNQGAGAWLVRAADGAGGNWTKGFAVADDLEKASGDAVMDYGQACDRARELARGGGNGAKVIPGASSSRPLTVYEAVDLYEKDLIIRKANKGNATQVRFHLTARLGNKPVALTVEKDFSDWREGIILKGNELSGADRIGRSLKAALNLQARKDKRITNSAEWRNGLSKLSADGENARCVTLEDAVVGSIIRAAYQHRHLLGVWCHLLSDTGARESQCQRLRVIDLQTSNGSSRLMISSSKKGKGRKVTHKPIPISSELANVLRQAAIGREQSEPMLEIIKRLSDKFEPIIKTLKLDPKITPYALRHSSIVRHLMQGTPTRLVASAHDTSVAEIERTYSRYIVSDKTEDILRGGLLTIAAPAPNIVKYARN